MKPTPAEILKFISRNQSDKIPPIAEMEWQRKLTIHIL
jgi:hypothetical protein